MEKPKKKTTTYIIKHCNSENAKCTAEEKVRRYILKQVRIPLVESEDRYTTDNNPENSSVSKGAYKAIDPVSAVADIDLANSKNNKTAPAYQAEDETDLQKDYQKQQSMALEDLPRLKKWLDEGIITQEEFNSVKKKVLGL